MRSLELARFHGFELLQATFFVISSCVLREGGREVSVFDINTAKCLKKCTQVLQRMVREGPFEARTDYIFNLLNQC